MLIHVRRNRGRKIVLSHHSPTHTHTRRIYCRCDANIFCSSNFIESNYGVTETENVLATFFFSLAYLGSRGEIDICPPSSSGHIEMYACLDLDRNGDRVQSNKWLLTVCAVLDAKPIHFNVI